MLCYASLKGAASQDVVLVLNHIPLQFQFPRMLRGRKGGEVHAAHLLHPSLAHVRGPARRGRLGIRIQIPGQTTFFFLFCHILLVRSIISPLPSLRLKTTFGPRCVTPSRSTTQSTPRVPSPPPGTTRRDRCGKIRTVDRKKKK